MVILPDKTIVIQGIIFLIVLITLSRFLFKPIMQVMDERWKKTDGLLKDSETVKLKTDSLKKKYDESIAQEKSFINEERAKLRVKAMENEKEILLDARKEAEEYKRKVSDNIAKDTDHAVAKLKKDAENISKAMASKILGRSLLFIIAFSLSFQNVGVAVASEASTHGTHEPFFSTGLLWSAINFSILLFLLIYILARPLKEFLASRRHAVQESMQNAKEAIEAAEAVYIQYNDKIKNIKEEAARIRQMIMDEASHEKERIIEEAKLKAEKILSEARLLAEADIVKTKQKIQAEIVEEAVGLAEEILTKNLTKEDQARLIQEYIKDLNKKEVYH